MAESPELELSGDLRAITGFRNPNFFYILNQAAPL
jgi:hypothetical protein